MNTKRIAIELTRFAFRTDGQDAPQELLESVRLAERQGYESAWFPGDRGIPARIGWLAGQTRTIRLGTGILPVFNRTATLTAETASALDNFSDHRFILGLGAGNPLAVEGLQGIPYADPLGRTREYLEIIRLLLAGKKVDYTGPTYTLRGVSIPMSGPTRVPLYLAAYAPKMLELAGELADGVLLNWPSPRYIPLALEHLERGARRSGRTLKDIDVAAYIRVAVTDDPGSVQRPLARQIVSFARYPSPRALFERGGFAQELAQVQSALERHDEESAIAAVSERMRAELGLCGTAAHCTAELERLRSAGIQLPIIAPFVFNDGGRSLETTVKAFHG